MVYQLYYKTNRFMSYGNKHADAQDQRGFIEFMLATDK
jgi:hypothetical protein